MQARNLLPTTVYLTEEHLDEARERAEGLSLNTGTLLRLILLGKQHPLGAKAASVRAWKPL